jgi:hypothetical protein
MWKMRKDLKKLLFLFPILLVLLAGCPEEADPAADGTITVNITGADIHNTKNVFLSAFNEGGPYVPGNELATSAPVIAGGAVSSTLEEPAANAYAFIFTGGESYDLSVLLDVDGDDSYTSAVDYILSAVRTVVVDGNMTVDLVYPEDFSIAP